MPDISVVIPCKDRQENLNRALDSVRGQSLLPAEVIVVDDGSRIPLLIQQNYPFPVHLIRQHNQGPSAARNCGIRRARGEWIALLDSDDTWAPHKLAVQTQLLARYPETGFCACHRDQIGWTGFSFVLSPAAGASEGLVEDALDQLVQDCCVPTSGVLFRKNAFVRAGGFDEILWYGEDWDFWLRLAAVTPVATTTDRLIAYYRSNDSLFDNVSRGEPTQFLEKDVYVLGKLIESDLFPVAIKAKAAARLREATRTLAYFYRRLGRPWQCWNAVLWSLRSEGITRPILKNLIYCVPHSLPKLASRLWSPASGIGSPQTKNIRQHILSERTAALARDLLGSCS